ncbi:MAG: AI-2E family transporter [Anaerolineaceae bacterium]|nr:AI-2E family transporter [Anaerolineaceae bacterium]
MQPIPPPEPQIEQWNWSPWVRQFVTVALVVVTVYALTLLGPILSILIITFLLSFLIFVPSRMLAKYTPLNYTGSVLIVFLVILMLIFVLVLVIAPSVAQVSRTIGTGLSAELSKFQDSIRNWDSTTPYNLSVLGLFQIDITQIASQIKVALLAADPTSAASQAIINNIPSLDVRQIVGTATQVITALIGTFTGFFSTLFLGLFLSLLVLLELPAYQHYLLSSGSAPFQRELRLIATKIVHVWQGFFRGQLLLAVIIGVITYIQLFVMGVPGSVPISIIVAVISLIPTIGGIIALLPLGLVPLLQGSNSPLFENLNNGTFALLVVGINLVISQIIWNVVAPKIMGDAVSLPLPVIIVGIIVGTALGGALGAFLIVPILGTARVIVVYLMAKIMQRDPFPGEHMPQFEALSKL